MMPLSRLAGAGLALGLGLAPAADAAPDLASRRMAGAVMVFADDARPDLWYVGPSELRIATGPAGAPDVSFLEMRYVGNITAGTRGLVLHKSLVTMRVQMPPYSREDLDHAARTLAPGGRAVELRPLPIRRIEASLVYAPVGAGTDTSVRALPGGRIGGGGTSAEPAGEGYWSERVFTVGLDSLTAQAFRSAFEAGQLAMSLGYAFVADGRAAAEPWGAVDGPRELTAELERQLAGAAHGGGAARDSIARRVVRAGAIRVDIDARRWPDLMRRVDLEDGTRAGYAALDVYCYDFRDGRRPDLYEKTVEVEAESVGGQPVRLQAAFARAHPDVYSATLAFPVAVKLDRPYRYRVAEFRPDGSSTRGSWRPGRDWVGLLDLTTPASPAAHGVRPIR